MLQSSSAPSGASGDFDRDGVLDLADPCPEIAAEGGCPNLPPKLPDADGDQIPDSADACPTVRRDYDPNEDGCPDALPPVPPSEARPPASAAPQPAREARPGGVGTTVSIRYYNSGRRTVFSKLQVRRIPSGATVLARCMSKGCPVRRYVKPGAAGTLSLRPFQGKRLRAGTVLEIRVTRARFVGVVRFVRTRAGRPPTVRTLCLPPGQAKPARC
jgi:hypothetical protein